MDIGIIKDNELIIKGQLRILNMKSWILQDDSVSPGTLADNEKTYYHNVLI
jgi:hypothetical protein